MGGIRVIVRGSEMACLGLGWAGWTMALTAAVAMAGLDDMYE